jgi:Fe2+ or Zn2+ uptake regulation protein
MKNFIIKRIKEEGLKLTPQRLAIIEILVDQSPLHPSASLVYHEAKRRRKSPSLSTVYATLNELSRHGIIKVLEFDKMENRYEGNISDHINLICKGCKKIFDYKNPLSIGSEEIKRKACFVVTDTRLDYYGYCQECRKK